MSHLVIDNAEPNEGSHKKRQNRMISWAKETIEWNSYLNYRGIDSLNDRIVGITERRRQIKERIDFCMTEMEWTKARVRAFVCLTNERA